MCVLCFNCPLSYNFGRETYVELVFPTFRAEDGPLACDPLETGILALVAILLFLLEAWLCVVPTLLKFGDIDEVGRPDALEVWFFWR